jgi:hypothetical protein
MSVIDILVTVQYTNSHRGHMGRKQMVYEGRGQPVNTNHPRHLILIYVILVVFTIHELSLRLAGWRF